MSSFRKRNVQIPIPGTRTSSQTGQVITSSGNPSLDVILGGGLPIGSICLIEEDKFVTHSKVLAKYFLAEGILSQQTVFLGSLDDVPDEMLKKLPRPLDDNEIEKENMTDDEEGAPKNGLRIAWRYNDLPLVNSEQTTTKIGHHFNLLEQMRPVTLVYAERVIWDGEQQTFSYLTEDFDTLGNDYNDENDESAVVQHFDTSNSNSNNNNNSNNNIKEGGDTSSSIYKKNDDVINSSAETVRADSMLFDESKEEKPTNDDDDDAKQAALDALKVSTHIFTNSKYLHLFQELQTLLREEKFTSAAHMTQRRLCRVCITSLGSPQWYDNNFDKDILKFLTVLRAIVRSSFTVCFITMPMHLVQKYDTTLVARIRSLVDFSIELESFAGSERETHPAYKEYSGLLHLHKIAAINTLSAYLPETFDLAFKLRRKKFVIEKLHLPPELQEHNNKNTTDDDIGISTAASTNCGGSSIVAAAAATAASLDF